jgi:hypothetical protein
MNGRAKQRMGLMGPMGRKRHGRAGGRRLALARPQSWIGYAAELGRDVLSAIVPRLRRACGTKAEGLAKSGVRPYRD